MYHNIFDIESKEIICGKNNVFAQFLQTKGLYDLMNIDEENINDLIALLNGKVRISTYCKKCKTERVFVMSPIMFGMEQCGEYVQHKLGDDVKFLQEEISSFDFENQKQEDGHWHWKNWQIDEIARVLVFKYTCTMDQTHHLDYIVEADNHSFRKIGQMPSVADLTFPELDIYKKVMTVKDRREFGRAIGLYASGIGAGAYVYLRRIFERLLLQARTSAGTEINDEEFNAARVSEKITLLKKYLPPMLTENPSIYGILSKGIHELSEEECLSYFPIIKDCIYLILDEWEEIRKKREKEKDINATLSKIASSIT